MTDDMDQHISSKQSAVSQDAFLAKKKFDTQKSSFEEYTGTDFDDDYSKDVNQLRHEIKLFLALLKESKLDDVIHLIANPSRLMGINFVIGFVRGIAFCLACLIMAMAILFSLSDKVPFGV